MLNHYQIFIASLKNIHSTLDAVVMCTLDKQSFRRTTRAHSSRGTSDVRLSGLGLLYSATSCYFLQTILFHHLKKFLVSTSLWPFEQSTKVQIINLEMIVNKDDGFKFVRPM